MWYNSRYEVVWLLTDEEQGQQEEYCVPQHSEREGNITMDEDITIVYTILYIILHCILLLVL